MVLAFVRTTNMDGAPVLRQIRVLKCTSLVCVLSTWEGADSCASAGVCARVYVRTDLCSFFDIFLYLILTYADSRALKGS